MRYAILSSVLLAGAALGGVGYWHFSRSERVDPPRAASTELAALRSEVEELKRSNAALVSVTRKAQGYARAAANAPGTSEQLNEPALIAQALEPGAAPPPTFTQEEVDLQIDNHFDDEQIDTGWSQNAARQIKQVLGQDLSPGSTLERVECRTNLCRVESNHSDIESFRAFAERTMAAMGAALWNGGASTSLRQEVGTPLVAVTYIAREGQSIPPPEVL